MSLAAASFRRRTKGFIVKNHGAGRGRTSWAMLLLRRTLATDEAEPVSEDWRPDRSKMPPIKWTTHRLTQEQIVKVDALFHKILWLDMFETSMLTDCINERLGLKVTPKQKKAIERQLELLDSSGAGAAGTADETPTEQVEAGPKLVDIKLSGFDAKSKIKVIKQVRSLLGGLGLKEAKELVESVPTVIQKEIKPEQAADIKKKLEEVGAQVELIEL